MNVVILGASGRTGRELVKQALAAGHKVTVVVRDPAKLPAGSDVRVVAGDAKDKTVLMKAFGGQQVVLSALGISRKNMDYSLMRDSTQAIVAAAKASGVKRIIIMSSFVALQDQLGVVAKQLTAVVMHKVVEDIRASEAMLQATDLDWTIVYAVALTNAPQGGVRVVSPAEKLRLRYRVSRADVAGFMLQTASESGRGKHAVVITGNK